MTDALLQGYSEEDLLEVARAAAALEVQAVSHVVEQLNGTLAQVVRMIHGTSGKVLLTGSGTSSHVARRLAHLLAVSGTPAIFIHAMDALHGTMGAVQPSDVLIAFSKTGESDEIVTLCSMVRDRGSKVIGVGENAASSLAKVSDIFVLLSTIDEADPGNTIAFGSTLVASLWGDAMARTLMTLHSWRLSDSLEIHPAGGVGKNIDAAGDGAGRNGD